MKEFLKGEKIEIKGDYFLVGKKECKNEKIIINLETKDEEIIEAFLELIGNKKYFYIKRKIMEKLSGKGIEYGGEKFQIIEEFWERKKIDIKWKRLRVFKLKKIGCKKHHKEYSKIIEQDKIKIFEGYFLIAESDYKIKETKENENKNLPKKIKIKYKEKI